MIFIGGDQQNFLTFKACECTIYRALHPGTMQAQESASGELATVDFSHDKGEFRKPTSLKVTRYNLYYSESVVFVLGTGKSGSVSSPCGAPDIS